MSRTVFLSAQPCFHGLHKPHADALCALIRRCVRLVFTGCLIYAIASPNAASGATSRSMTRAFSCRASRKS